MASRGLRAAAFTYFAMSCAFAWAPATERSEEERPGSGRREESSVPVLTYE